MTKNIKEIYRFKKLVGYKWCDKKERTLARSKEYKKFFRGKRRGKNLPDSYTDTKFLKRIRNWKNISKNKKQWMLNLSNKTKNILKKVFPGS